MATVAQALQNERYRAHRAVRTLLEVLATKPTLLVLDDFHWADSASIELTGALLRRPPAAPVLLVLAFRPRQLPGRLAAELSRAERNDLVTRIELAPLSAPAARELLGTGFGGPRRRSSTRRAAECRSTSSSWRGGVGRRRAAARRGDSGAELQNVPSMVQSALAEELTLLSDGGRRVLQGAAVAGDPFEPELAAAAAGMTEAGELTALDELLELDFVRPTTCRGASASAIRSSAAPSTRRRPPAGASAPTSARRRHSPRAAPRRGAGPPRRALRAPGRRRAVALLAGAGEDAAGRASGSADRWYGGARGCSGGARARRGPVRILLAARRRSPRSAGARESHEVLEAESGALRRSKRRAVRGSRPTACAGIERPSGAAGAANARLRERRQVEPGQRRPSRWRSSWRTTATTAPTRRTMRRGPSRAAEEAEALGDPR